MSSRMSFRIEIFHIHIQIHRYKVSISLTAYINAVQPQMRRHTITSKLTKIKGTRITVRTAEMKVIKRSFKPCSPPVFIIPIFVFGSRGEEAPQPTGPG